jgi:putative mRNA 3-end processing factor
MLGSVQVQVDLPNGARVGYSGDFGWPLQGVITVDELVVDSTYGSPADIRKFSQGECEARFMELVLKRLKRGPVHILAHRGTLHRALQLLSGNLPCPMLGSSSLLREVVVYREFGYTIQHLLRVDSVEGVQALAARRFIRFYGTGDMKPVDVGQGTTITLSAYLAGPDNPVAEYSDRAYRVALSNHADFNGTLEYVRATGAKSVVTDNSRAGKGYELALAIRTRLGIEAKPSSNFDSKEWGM